MPSLTRRRRVEDNEDETEHITPPSQRRSQQSRSTNGATSSSAAGPSGSRNNAAASSSRSTVSNGIDLNQELEPQPLGREHVPNVRSLTAELRSQDRSILKCIELLNETAEQLAEAFRTQDECNELKQADANLRELIDAQAEKAIRQKVLDEIAQDLHTGVRMEDPAKRYKEDVQTQLDTYNNQTSRQKYAKNADYHNFKNAIWVTKEDGPMPPVKDLIPAEPGDEDASEDDDDIQTGGVVQNFRCPLGTDIMEDPLSNTACTHSYSRAAIEKYVAAGNNICPAFSCTAQVSRHTLKQDPLLVKKSAL
ncbi:hypothetical protein [Sporisorium scitamineum]|uniref:SP-RING-type domain-containing protein n=1 Tax=Sporisorium scitamineum TaxID=49012 RepID=A0A0F7RZZ3_9BASI|nr:hypothetical protein [Sporisorium scitamineum]